jgi:hypothetical protein
MVLRRKDNRIELRPRYFFIVRDFEKQDRKLKYGQDGPIYAPSEWTYLTRKIRTFLAQMGIVM